MSDCCARCDANVFCSFIPGLSFWQVTYQDDGVAATEDFLCFPCSQIVLDELRETRCFTAFGRNPMPIMARTVAEAFANPWVAA